MTSWQVFDMWGTVMLTKPDTTAYGLGWAWDGTCMRAPDGRTDGLLPCVVLASTHPPTDRHGTDRIHYAANRQA